MLLETASDLHENKKTKLALAVSIIFNIAQLIIIIF